jgi:hypothetical protein
VSAPVPPLSGPGAPSYARIAGRILGLWALTLVVLVLLALPVRLARPALRAAGHPIQGLAGVAVDHPILIPIGIVEVLAALLATHIMRRRAGLGWGEVGFARGGAGPDLLLGIVIGVIEFALVPLFAAAGGWVELGPGGVPGPSARGVLLSLAVVVLGLLPAAAFEEITDRGYALTQLAARSRVVAVVATALAFTVMHAWNPGFNAVACAHVFAAGVALAVGRLRSGALWLPIGWHFGWNAAQGWLFGAVVSGMQPARQPLLALRLDGPALLTGGAFGPESGLLAVAASVVVLLAYVKLVPAPAPVPPHRETTTSSPIAS